MAREPLRVLDLFSGIGGFSLGLERTGGFQTVAFCEIEEFPRQILARHWPDVPIFNDVRELNAERLRERKITVDVITGGFPCQDLSVAGKQTGIHGERSGLFGEIIRLAGELRPRYIILENVAALLAGDNGGWARHVFGSLAEIGFDAEWHVIPAGNLNGLSAGAPHRRERVWIVAYPRNCSNSAISKTQGNANNLPGKRGQNGHARLPVRTNIDGTILAYPNSAGGKIQRGFRDGRAYSWTKEEQVNKLGKRKGPEERPTKPGLGLLAHGLHAGLFGRAWLPEPDIGRVASGIPDRAKKLKALGNSVVPQIPELIGRAILNRENELNET